MKAFTNFESRYIRLPINNIDTDQIIPARFLKTTSKKGLDKIFRDAGADFREAGCSMCLAMNGD